VPNSCQIQRRPTGYCGELRGHPSSPQDEAPDLSSQIKGCFSCVAGQGFEPWKASADGFTVRCRAAPVVMTTHHNAASHGTPVVLSTCCKEESVAVNCGAPGNRPSAGQWQRPGTVARFPSSQPSTGACGQINFAEVLGVGYLGRGRVPAPVGDGVMGTTPDMLRTQLLPELGRDLRSPSRRHMVQLTVFTSTSPLPLLAGPDGCRTRWATSKGAPGYRAPARVHVGPDV
jgi:hypothetical protein